jgi:hypothetical protein
MNELVRAAPCVCGATWESLELVGESRFFVSCTRCRECERGASKTHAGAVDSWNRACWSSPRWREARERGRIQRFNAMMLEYQNAEAQAIADDIDRQIIASLSGDPT